MVFPTILMHPCSGHHWTYMYTPAAIATFHTVSSHYCTSTPCSCLFKSSLFTPSRRLLRGALTILYSTQCDVPVIKTSVRYGTSPATLSLCSVPADGGRSDAAVPGPGGAGRAGLATLPSSCRQPHPPLPRQPRGTAPCRRYQ
jgi:hypothetical protein